MDAAGDPQTEVRTASPIGAFGSDVGTGKKKLRFEIVKYLDKTP